MTSTDEIMSFTCLSHVSYLRVYCNVCAQDGWKMDPSVTAVRATGDRGLWMLVFAGGRRGRSWHLVED